MAEEETIALANRIELINLFIDKGIAVNAWISVTLIGIELLAIEARVIVTLVETTLNFEESSKLNASSAKQAIQTKSYSY